MFLKDIWPSSDEILEAMKGSISKEMFIEKYRDLEQYNENWKNLQVPSGTTYSWDPNSTYIQRPPFFENFNPESVLEYRELKNARPLLMLGDSVTTDHISPVILLFPDIQTPLSIPGRGWS